MKYKVILKREGKFPLNMGTIEATSALDAISIIRTSNCGLLNYPISSYEAIAQVFLPKKEPINELENIMTKINTQEALVSAIKNTFYIVGSYMESEGGISFCAQPVAHYNTQSARAECVRLSKLFPGKIYFFVKMCGAEMIPASPQGLSI